MIKCKNETIYNLFKDFYLKIKRNDNNFTYNEIIKFCKENNLEYGIVNLENNELNLYTNKGYLYIKSNGEIGDGKGNYSKFNNDDPDLEEMDNDIKNDINSINNVEKDIICINAPILEEME